MASLLKVYSFIVSLIGMTWCLYAIWNTINFAYNEKIAVGEITSKYHFYVKGRRYKEANGGKGFVRYVVSVKYDGYSKDFIYRYNPPIGKKTNIRYSKNNPNDAHETDTKFLKDRSFLLKVKEDMPLLNLVMFIFTLCTLSFLRSLNYFNNISEINFIRMSWFLSVISLFFVTFVFKYI